MPLNWKDRSSSGSDLPVREGTSRVRLLHSAAVVRAAFDDPNLVSYAGLEPVMRLAEACDLPGIVRERLHVPTDKGANASGKVATIVAGMVTGADSIDDLDVVRHGGMAELFGGVLCALDAGIVPAHVQPRPCPPTPGRRPRVPGPARTAHAAAARRGCGHVHRPGLPIAPDVWQEEARWWQRSVPRTWPRSSPPLNCGLATPLGPRSVVVGRRGHRHHQGRPRRAAGNDAG
jgi:hypothetical protein